MYSRAILFLAVLAFFAVCTPAHAKDEPVGNAQGNAPSWPVRAYNSQRQGYIVDGEEFTQFSTEIGHRDNCGMNNKQSPLVSGLAASGKAGLVVGATGRHLVAVDTDGSVAWEYPRVSNNQPAKNQSDNPAPISDTGPCAFYSSPVIGGNDTVFVSSPSRHAPASGRTEATITAVSLKDGSVVFNTTLPAVNAASNTSRMCTPIALGPGGLVGYVSCLNGTSAVSLYAFNPATGDVRMQKGFAPVGAIETNVVTDLLPSDKHPGTVYFATMHKFYSCTPTKEGGETAPFDVNCWELPHTANAPVKIAESSNGSPFLYTHDGAESAKNSVQTIDLKDKKLAESITLQNNGTSIYSGALSLYASSVFTVAGGRVIAYSEDLKNVTWTSDKPFAADIETGIAVGRKNVYVFTPNAIFSVSHLTSSLGKVGKVIPLSADAGYTINPGTDIIVSGAGRGAVLVASGTKIEAFSLLGEEKSGDDGPKELGAGTVALIVIFSVMLGVVLFGAIWYFNNQKDRDRLPLI